jgi:DNA-binding protein H-NS
MSAFVQPFQISEDINQLLAQKAAAKAQLENADLRLSEGRTQYIPQLRGLIAMFDYTAEELFPKPEKKAVVVDKDYSPDYFFRDPETGAEWDGKGKRPGFLSKKKKTDDFRIYHATGTKYPPVVKPALVQGNSSSSGVSSPLAVAPTAPPVAAAMPEAQTLGVASALHHQPAMTVAALPVAVDHSTSVLQINASAEATALPS